MSPTHDDSLALHAWVDESVHVEHGLYVLAAVVADTSQCEEHRELLRSLRRPTRPRLHWNDEERKDQLLIAQAIGRLDLSHVVAVASPIERTRQERGRRKCIDVLLPHLDGDGVTSVWFESRGKYSDKKDIAMVAALRTQRRLTAGIRADHARPLDEPMLWAPDAIAGIISADRKQAPDFKIALGCNVLEIDVPV